jgi:hypothetical protein
MAQTAFTPLQLYSSSTASAAPAAGNLTNSTLGSELAINITDGKLFYKDNANAVQVIGWKVVPTTAGGTGLISYSQGDLLYYNSGTTLIALAKSTTATRYLSNTGSNNNPAWAQIDLSNGVTGTLPVGNGGTGTATAFTAGSVIFAGASGVYSQDNAALFYDNTNDRLGIGTATPGYRLDITRNGGGGDSAQLARFTDSNTSNGVGPLHLTLGATNHFASNPGMVLAGTNGIALAVGDGSDLAGQRQLTIDSSGNVMVGTTSPILSGSFSVLSAATAGSFRISASAAAGIVLDVSRTAASGDMVYFRTGSTTLAGFISCPTTVTTTYNSVSDYRLKENVAPMTGALAKVAALKPVTYTWNTDGLQGQGFLAHELQAVVPECVTGEKDAVQTVDDLDVDGKKIGTKEVPRYQGVDTSFLVATLVAAIQEQQALITQLQADVSALKGS